MDTHLHRNIEASILTLRSLESLADPLRRAAEMAGKCLTSGHKLLTCGNGGSASDASHLATEFVCRFHSDRRPFPAVALTDSGGTLTAIGNDYGFDEVFARQVRAFAQQGDVLIAISTSGNSMNVVKALQAARELNIDSISFLGKGGGACKGLATVELLVPSQVTARVQEAQLLLYHTLCEMVEPLLVGT
jgi:D-sedoheptulose 7-phosphate isomerase